MSKRATNADTIPSNSSNVSAQSFPQGCPLLQKRCPGCWMLGHNTRNISIPHSASDLKPRPATLVTVTRDMLYVNGEAIVSVADVGSTAEPVVEPLRAALGRESAGLLPGTDAQREVTVMAEKSLPYAVLRKIVASCSAADYTKVSLAVVEREQALAAQSGA